MVIEDSHGNGLASGSAFDPSRGSISGSERYWDAQEDTTAASEAGMGPVDEAPPRLVLDRSALPWPIGTGPFERGVLLFATNVGRLVG